MKNNKSFGSVAVLIIIVVVLAIGGVAYYAGKSSKITPSNVEENNFNNVSNTTTQDIQVDNSLNNVPHESGDDQNGQHIGYIKSILGSNGNYSLKIDYTEWLIGKNAINAALEDGECSIEGKSKTQAIQELETYDISMGYGVYGNCAPNGYYIRNQNTKLRTFLISNTVNITTITKPTGDGLYSDPELHQEPIFIESFKPLFQNNTIWTQNIPFWITLNNGVITEITEQYLP
jgi:hypothetical protein